jgi:tetratricopeptide (TPR) repeat protein
MYTGSRLGGYSGGQSDGQKAELKREVDPMWTNAARLIVGIVLGCFGAGQAYAADPAAAEGRQVSAAVAACLDQAADSKEPGKLQTAITVCGFALQASDTLSPLERAVALEHRGIAYRNANNLEKSLADLTAAKALAPDEPSVARMLAWTYRGLGRMADAEQEYDRALKLDAHWQGYLSRCVVRLDQKEYAKALADCEIAHQMQPSEDSTFFTGWLLGSMKRPDDAIKVFETAVNSPPEAGLASGRIYGELANIYKATGKSTGSNRVAAAGRKRFPADPELGLPAPKR